MRRVCGVVLCVLGLFLAAAASADDASATSATNNTAAAANTAACGSTIGGPCCKSSPAWTCAADLVCLDYSDVGKTSCHPMPGSPAAPCGGPGQACCPDAYHRHVDKPLPPACADGYCDRSGGATPCATLGGDDNELTPCGVCRSNKLGCGSAAGAPCCRFSKGGPSDWFTCGPPPSEAGAPPPGSLACDVMVGDEPKCVAAT